MQNSPFTPHQPLIEMDTDDAVWEWRVANDILCLSKGAKRMFGMNGNIPESMFSFISECMEEKRELLQQSLQTFVEGHIGAHVEMCFPINGILARCQLVTITRSPHGRAEQIIGCISAIDRQSPGLLPSARFSIQQISNAHTTQDHARLMLALNASGDGLWDWDAVTNSVYYSPRYIEMLGYTPDTFPAVLSSWEEKIHPDDHIHVVPMQKDIIASPTYGDSFECTYRMRRADGSWAWILGRGNVTQRNGQGQATRVVGLHTDISASQADRAHLENLVRNDPLTGLRSRTFFTMTVDELEQQAVRPVGVIAADVNGLKMINDHLGHEEGNAVLCQAALLLRGGLDSAACVARMSGDEYTVLLPGCSIEAVAEVMHALLQRFERHNEGQNRSPVLLAMGCACAETMQTSIASAIVEADRAMLRHKLTTRSETRQRIKKWIESHTNARVSLNDCRYL
ncbi:MAG: sensor domain-containing diguanylate cyclase [Desulfovibrio sp.]|nr:sensor domain-containing diguanylate cyclase [Desulfovibrio sp.]